MRLHRQITPDLPLIVVALEEEAAHLHTSDIPVLVTGIGKVNAALATSQILGEYTPKFIANLGTAGALKDGLSGTFDIGTVIQHDFNDEGIFRITGLHFGEPITLEHSGPVLATGDAFIDNPTKRAELAAHADLVDMEGYAVAKAAIAHGVPVRLVKQVSDNANESADRSWKQSVDECAEILGAWFNEHLRP